MTFLPTAKSETIFFQGLAGKKKKPSSRMTFLAASETRIFLRLALEHWAIQFKFSVTWK